MGLGFRVVVCDHRLRWLFVECGGGGGVNAAFADVYIRRLRLRLLKEEGVSMQLSRSWPLPSRAPAPSR